MASTARSTQERVAERQAANDAFYVAQEEERERRREYVANRMVAERNRRMQMEAVNDALYTNEESGSVKPVGLLSYAPMLMAAGFKDLLDLTGIGSLPGIGTVVTICASILIFFLALLRGSFRGRMKYRKGIMLLVGTLVEAIGFGLNFLPIETLTVLAMYMIDKAEAKGGMIGKVASGIKTNAIKKGSV
ncbi:MAG: hypothetical protein WAU28_01160 [Candidatus Moraniibacteriota bacterium]